MPLEECVLPDEKFLNDPLNTEFEFVFKITIGKVARMTEGNAKWMVGYQITDESGTMYGYYNSKNGAGLKMEWYCEVEAPDSINWGNIIPGSDYEDSSARQSVAGIKYISNGRFNEQVKFDSDWKGADNKKSAKLTVDAANSNEFALKVSCTDNLKDSKQIPADGSYVVTSENDSATTYEGLIRDDYHFYIKLNKNFDLGKYMGKVTFGVTNG